MKIGIIGTGTIGRAHAAKLSKEGHAATIDTRDPRTTLARAGKYPSGNPPFVEWAKANPGVKLGTSEEAAKNGEMIINAIKSDHTLETLEFAKEGNLNGKVMIDVSNPLDLSRGMLPSLTVSNTDSLGELVQRMLPKVKLVKTLNTINAYCRLTPDSWPMGVIMFS